MLRPMNPHRVSSLPGCAAARQGYGRRKPASLPRCTANRGRPPRESPRESSWAAATTPAQRDIITARVRISGPSPADPADDPARKDQTSRPDAHARGPSGPARRPSRLAAAVRSDLGTLFAQAGAAWAWVRPTCARLLTGPDERLTSWMSDCLAQAGDLVFAISDAEASWHAWDIVRRDAGLARAYRDPRFDTLVPCPRCHSVSTVADGSVCRPCSAAERLVHV
jgi:hypothetical protein